MIRVLAFLAVIFGGNYPATADCGGRREGLGKGAVVGLKLIIALLCSATPVQPPATWYYMFRMETHDTGSILTDIHYLMVEGKEVYRVELKTTD